MARQGEERLSGDFRSLACISRPRLDNKSRVNREIYARFCEGFRVQLPGPTRQRCGVPVVLELGPRDLALNQIVLKRRDTGAKETVPQLELAARLPRALDQMQQDLYDTSKLRLKSNTVTANSVAEVESILKDVTAEKGGGKFVMAHVKDDPACDARMKEFKATIRCVPLVDEYDGPGKCIVTGEPVERRVLLAKAY